MSRSGRYFLALQEERKWHRDMDEKAEARFRERYLRGFTTSDTNKQQHEQTTDQSNVDRGDQQVTPPSKV